LPLLELQGVGKEFGAIRALSNVSLSIEPGEVLGLMGDNGAGKSTLVKIIAGNFPASHGTVKFEGREVHFAKPIDARAIGIEVVYQDLALADNLSAAANVFLGRELTRKVGPFKLLDHAAMNRRTADLFGELKSETRASDLVRAMSGGQRQAVASPGPASRRPSSSSWTNRRPRSRSGRLPRCSISFDACAMRESPSS